MAAAHRSTWASLFSLQEHPQRGGVGEPFKFELSLLGRRDRGSIAAAQATAPLRKMTVFPPDGRL